MATILKLLIHHKSGKKFLVKDIDEPFYTEFGTITSSQLQSAATAVESSTKERFSLITPTFPDLWEHLARGPQVLLHKDIGLIIAKTGANSSYMAVDAGGGSGSLCFSLANVCKSVIVYETHPEHDHLLQKNKHLLGLQNVILKQENIYEGIEEQECHLITLDLPEPWRVIVHAEKALVVGGFLVVYLPNLTQVQQFTHAVTGTSLHILETVELLEREWKIGEKILRPEFQMLGHTGFLTFVRKW